MPRSSDRTLNSEERTEPVKTLEIDEILADVADTSFACARLERLTGGMMNLTCRGFLLHPLSPDGIQTVIFKRGRSVNHEVPGWDLPLSRCVVEQAILRRIGGEGSVALPIVRQKHILVRPPRLLDFNPESSTMILEDIPDSRRLYETAAELGKDGASSVGEAVGRWLVGFHRWSNENLDAKMIALAESNGTALKRLRDNAYTKLLEHCRDERVPHAAWQHLTRQDDQVRRVVYGDMSARNILVREKGNGQIHVAPIDWEACSVASPMQDLAGFISWAFVQHCLARCPASLSMLQGFIRGYGPVDSQSVCDVAVFLGLYLFLWASILTEEAAPCRVENVYQFAGELIIMGTEKDIHRIHGTFLGRLLRS